MRNLDLELGHPEAAHPESAGWALGTLDPDDAVWFAGHLPACADCRAAVAEFGPTVRLLEMAAPAVMPPPELRGQTLAEVAREVSKTWWRRWSARTMALAAAVIAIAGTVAGFVLTAGTAAESYALVLHSGPGQSASARGTIRQAGSGWSVQLTAVHLPKLGPGQLYQCWWAGPGNRPAHPDLVSAGAFTASASGTATVQMWTAANPDDFTAIEITRDSAARPGQPGPVVLSGTVANA